MSIWMIGIKRNYVYRCFKRFHTIIYIVDLLRATPLDRSHWGKR